MAVGQSKCKKRQKKRDRAMCERVTKRNKERRAAAYEKWLKKLRAKQEKRIKKLISLLASKGVKWERKEGMKPGYEIKYLQRRCRKS